MLIFQCRFILKKNDLQKLDTITLIIFIEFSTIGEKLPLDALKNNEQLP